MSPVPTDAPPVVLRRYAQFAVDHLLAAVVSVLFAIGLFALALVLIDQGVLSRSVGPYVIPTVAWSYAAALLLTVLWAQVWSPLRHGGASPGMRLLGLRVRTLDGGEPTLGAYLLRWLVMAVDGQLFGLVGAVLIAVTPRRQRLGDVVARTVVERVRPGGTAPEPGQTSSAAR
ncbi:putative membrane protein YckC, RDD family [Actinosynnema pretiosum]|nr:putative membrane protein YckC, RDD family [Actinosynnema pretiosum]